MSNLYQISDTRVNYYYLLASSVVFYYDYILTLPQEYKFLWTKKMNIVTLLILTLRYVTASSYLIIFALAFAPGIAVGDRCPRLARIPGGLGVVCQCITLAFLVIRLFAVFERKRWVLFVFIPFALLCVTLSSSNVLFDWP